MFTTKERYNVIQYKVILYVYLLMLAVGPGRLQISDDMS